MPGHSYKGSTAGGNAPAAFPPTPVASYNGVTSFFELAVLIAACTAGRPGFIGYISDTGGGNPTTNPGEWFESDPEGAADTGTHYVDTEGSGAEFFIGRCFYGFNFSGWSNVVDLGG